MHAHSVQNCSASVGNDTQIILYMFAICSEMMQIKTKYLNQVCKHISCVKMNSHHKCSH